jgi:hypothetical protein
LSHLWFKILQIKLASVKLAMKYMRRVSAELEADGSGSPEEEELIVQCVRFAFRVHQVKLLILIQKMRNLVISYFVIADCGGWLVVCQFAGGFDVETMRAFQELREKARSCHVHCQNQQQQKFICRSTTPC